MTWPKNESRYFFYKVWTEVRKLEGLRKKIFVFNKGKTSCCLSPGIASLYKT